MSRSLESGDTVRVRFGLLAGRIGEVSRVEGRLIYVRIGGSTVSYPASALELA